MHYWQESSRFDHPLLAIPMFNVTKPLHADAFGKTRQAEIVWRATANARFGIGRNFDTFDIILLLPVRRIAAQAVIS